MGKDGQTNQAAEIAATEKKIESLSLLNTRLIAQVSEARQETQAKEVQQSEVLAELASEKHTENFEAEQVTKAHERLDQAAASEGSLCRQVRQLRNQAQMLQKQVSTLDTNAEQTGLQLEEAEAALGKLQEESEATEWRAEIIHWKLQVAETQLTNRHPRPFRESRESRSSAGNGMRERVRDAALSSDSTGAGPGTAGGSLAP